MKATIYGIEGRWRGRLAIAARPRGKDWLEDEVRAWHEAGIKVVMSTLTQEEEDELGLAAEAELCRSHGLEVLSFPIPDRGVPASLMIAKERAQTLERKLAEGKNVLVHCRQGIGRSSLLAAALLGMNGIPVETAFERVSAARGCPVPDTKEQRQWVERFARTPAKIGE